METIEPSFRESTLLIQFILLIYYCISLFLISSCFITNRKYNETASGLCTYFLFRMITDYRKCTMSYMECKLRGVKKEKGIIFAKKKLSS